MYTSLVVVCIFVVIVCTAAELQATNAPNAFDAKNKGFYADFALWSCCLDTMSAIVNAALSCSMEFLLLASGAVVYRVTTTKIRLPEDVKRRGLPQDKHGHQKRESSTRATSEGAAGARVHSRSIRDKEASTRDERREQQSLARFTRLINECSKLADGPEQAWSKIREMRQMGLVPNAIHYGAAIGVCSRNECAYTVAFGLMDEMRQFNLMPDEVCYNAAITACGRAGQCELCFRLLGEMRELGLRPGVITYNAMIDSCARAKEDAKARQLLMEMRSLGLEPTVTSYGSVINAYAKVSNWRGATELLEEMDRFGVVPNVTSYSAAMNACAKVGNWQESLRILRSMQLRGAQPNQICYSTCINACLKGDECGTAIELLKEMKDTGIEPDDVTYHVIIRDLRKKPAKYKEVVATLQAERQVLRSQGKQRVGA